jgi:hypothetical protein
VFFGGGRSGAQSLYADIKGRMEKLGRNRDHLKILPGAFVVVGDTSRKPRKSARCSTARCITPAPSPPSRSQSRHRCASGFDPDGPLPEIPETNASKSGRERVIALARENLTVRQLAQRLGGYGGSAFVSARPRPSPTRCRNGWKPRPRRLQHHVPLPAGGAERLRRQGRAGTAKARDFPHASMKARRCARISACHGPPTAQT